MEIQDPDDIQNDTGGAEPYPCHLSLSVLYELQCLSKLLLKIAHFFPDQLGILNLRAGARADVAADVDDKDLIGHVNLALVHPSNNFCILKKMLKRCFKPYTGDWIFFRYVVLQEQERQIRSSGLRKKLPHCSKEAFDLCHASVVGEGYPYTAQAG